MPLDFLCNTLFSLPHTKIFFFTCWEWERIRQISNVKSPNTELPWKCRLCRLQEVLKLKLDHLTYLNCLLVIFHLLALLFSSLKELVQVPFERIAALPIRPKVLTDHCAQLMRPRLKNIAECWELQMDGPIDLNRARSEKQDIRPRLKNIAECWELQMDGPIEPDLRNSI